MNKAIFSLLLLAISLLALYGFFFNGANRTLVSEKKIKDTSVIFEKNVKKEIAPLTLDEIILPPAPEKESMITETSNKIGKKIITTVPFFNIPSSYPIAEAEKYFIPKEKRTSGFIGGPPPLNFPQLNN